jgi:rifampicin phosphotransferase
VLLVAIGIFMAGALLCGLAQSMAVLVVGRIIQGMGGGGLMIGAQAVLGEVVSPRERGRYLGLLSGVYILAAVGGPLLGGLIVDHLSWRWIFAGYLPLGLLGLIMVRRTLRLPAPQARLPIDYAGAILLAIAVLALVLLASVTGRAGQIPVWVVPVLIIMAIAATVAWLLTARRAADPILPLRLFRDRSFAIPTAISFLIGFALFGTVSYLPSYLQIAAGSSSTRAGLVVTCLMTGVIITLIISGQLISRTGRYRIFPIMGTALATGGLALLATVIPAISTPVMLAHLLLIGLGIGMTMQVMMLVAQNGAPRADLGTATSTVTLLRQIGASAGVSPSSAPSSRCGSSSDCRKPSSIGFRGVRVDCRPKASTPCPPIYGQQLPRRTEPRSHRYSATWHRSSALHSSLRSRCPRARYATPRTPMICRPRSLTRSSPTRARRERHMVDMLARREERLVTRINAVRRDDLELVGGKGANLGELMQAGFPIPDGFIVSTQAYARVVEEAGLAAVITDGLAAADDGATIRTAFENVTIPDRLAATIIAAYADRGDGPVAVRSSATAEDLAEAAFAGQQDTYLNVVGEDALLDAVRRCWGSLWTERAIVYRRRQRIESGNLRIAVVVQRMVDAEFAGVMFTANPVTGERDEVVVDANPGLGEAVVSGLVTPDHYVLDAEGHVQQHTPGRREVIIRSAADGGVTRSSEAGPASVTLPDSVLKKLAVLGRSVAAHFGRPQDIEWAYAGGQTWLVQARPMTALPPPPLKLNRTQRKFGFQLMDYMSVRPYPLDMSAWVKPGIGLMVDRMLAEIAGIRIDITGALPERDGVVDRFVPPDPRPTRATPRALARLPRRIRRYDPARWTEDERFVSFEHRMRELGTLDPTTLSWTELLQVCRRALTVTDLITDLRVDYLPGMGFALLRLLALLALLGSSEMFGLLTAGARTRTDDANRGLEELATQVRADSTLRKAFQELDPAALAARLNDDARLAGFRKALGQFLAEYGHRETLSILVMTAPTWADDPTPVLGLIKLFIEEPPQPTAAEPSAEAERRLLDHHFLRSPRRRSVVLRALDAARQGIAFREDSHFYATRALPILRRTLLEAGRRLTAAGVLSNAEDAFHLRLEELEAVTDPDRLTAAEADRLRAAARDRATRRAELAHVPMLSAASLLDPAVADKDTLVTGVGASRGRASGPVRIIREPAEFGSMGSGDVLVCPYTNPAWTPLFQRAAAVVVDSGGVGSHAAIVAREYGIPAVMGTVIGTTVLVDGQLIMVDGDSGRVTAA